MLSTANSNSKRRDYEQMPSCRAQLPFIISLPTATRNSDGTPRTVKLAGHTRYISADELELVGPFIRFGNRSLMSRDYSFQILIGLPSGAIRLRAYALSYIQLDESELGLGYLVTANHDTDNASELKCVIKARITELSDGDRAKLVQYLSTLTPAGREQTTVMVMDGNGRWHEQQLTVTVMA